MFVEFEKCLWYEKKFLFSTFVLLLPLIQMSFFLVFVLKSSWVVFVWATSEN